MALDIHQNFVSLIELENKCIEFQRNFVNAFIVLRSTLGLLPPIFCSFVTVIAKSDVRNLFLLNIFSLLPFYGMKKYRAR